MQFIDLKTQYERYKAEIDRRIHAVLDHGRFIMGPEIAELETALAEYVGVAHCLTVSSGTASLEIALRALDIGPGDEVITVPFTWISTAEVIALVGAKPVFVDICPDDFNIDIDQIETAITPRTKAIMPVSLFGQMPDYDRINAIAARHGLPVIEDGAQSFGATRHGRRSCGVTTIGSTSFFPAKPFGCFGDGGALFTNDDLLASKMSAIRNHGGMVRHHHTLVGTNGRFDTLQAAVLLAKLPHFPWEVERRNAIGARYTTLLEGTGGRGQGSGGRGQGSGDRGQESGVRGQETGVRRQGTGDRDRGQEAGDRAQPPTSISPRCQPGNTHVYAQYTIRVADRDALGARLKEAGIPSAVYYPKCLHQQPVFEPLGYIAGAFPVAEQAALEVISLPMHPFLTDEEQDRIVEVAGDR